MDVCQRWQCLVRAQGCQMATGVRHRPKDDAFSHFKLRPAIRTCADAISLILNLTQQRIGLHFNILSDK